MLHMHANWENENSYVTRIIKKSSGPGFKQKKINKKKSKGRELPLKVPVNRTEERKTTNKHTCETQKASQVKSIKYNKVYLQ